MQFDHLHQKPTPHATSECPLCKSKLVAKCGSIKIWHWAHESLEECDGWYEPMSEWHLEWQSYVPEEMREVIVGHHIADIKLPSGKVIEIQHSNLPVEVVAEREAFYGNMVWVFDGREFEERFKTREKESVVGNTYWTFKFKRPRQYIVRASKFPVYIDFGEDVFVVKKFNSYNNKGTYYGVEREYTSWAGWGYWRQKDSRLFAEIFGVSYIPKPKTIDGGIA